MNSIVVEVDNNSFNKNTKDLDNMLGMLPVNPNNIKYRLAVKCDRGDLIQYDAMIDKSPSLKNLLEDNSKDLRTMKHLNKDIFLLLYKDKPVIRKESDMFYTHLYNYRIIKEIIQLESFNSLRQTCNGDVNMCLMGLVSLQENIQKCIEEWKENLQDYLSLAGVDLVDYNDLLAKENIIETKYTALQNKWEKLKDLEDPDYIQTMNYTQAQVKSEIDSLKQDIEDIQIGLNQDIHQTYDPNMGIIKNLDEMEHEDQESISENVATTFSDADEFMTDVVPFIDSYGLGHCSGTIIPYETKLKAIKKMTSSKKLKEIIDNIGKIENGIDKKARQKTKENGHTVCNIKTGKSVTNMLPGEKMLMANNTAKKDLYRKMSSNQLMNYDKNRKAPLKKGSVIFLGDESGSMDGSKERYLKAMAIIFMKRAVSQGRDFCYIPFSDGIGKPIFIDPKDVDAEKVYQLATNFMRGGTNYEIPLKKAVSILEQSKFKNADLIMVTDGESELSEGFMKKYEIAKMKKKFEVTSILINVGSRVSDATLKKFSDNVYKLSDLTTSGTKSIKDAFNI